MAEWEEEESRVAEVEEWLDTGRPLDEPSLVAKHRKDLKKICSTLAMRIRKGKQVVRQGSARIRELKDKLKGLRSTRQMALRQMASSQLRRVGCPEDETKAVEWSAEGRLGESLLLDVATLHALPQAFNDLYMAIAPEELAEADLWQCSVEDTRRPEKDLLGMCPTGKQHHGPEQLEQLKLSKCHCLACGCERKMEPVNAELPALQEEVAAARKAIEEAEPLRKHALRVLRRLGRGGAEMDHADAVFDAIRDHAGPDVAGVAETEEALAVQVADGVAEMEEALAAQGADRDASPERRRWDEVRSTLTPEDFPIRLVFLDKSGSMGCDRVTFDALMLALNNSLYPERGSTLIFLMAAPGETEFLFRRPGQGFIRMEVELGCATWFNEPVLMALSHLAPVIEAVWSARGGQSWEAPVQVLCLTDGQDNCSQTVTTLNALVRQLKEIKGPQSRRRLYQPLLGPVPAEGDAVPVWLCWMVCGQGGMGILDGGRPKELCVVDAVCQPQHREPPPPRRARQESSDEEADGRVPDGSTVASRARMVERGVCVDSGVAQASSSAWAPGHRVRLGPVQPGRAPKHGVVLQRSSADPSRLELLMADEQEVTVSASELLGRPAASVTLLRSDAPGRRNRPDCNRGVAARTATPQMQRLQTLALVDCATRDLGVLMCTGSGNVSLEAGVRAATGREEVDADSLGALNEKVDHAVSAIEIASTQGLAVEESKLLKDVMRVVGRTTSTMIPEDRAAAQKLISAGLEALVSGGALKPAFIFDQLADGAGVDEERAKRRIPIATEHIEMWEKKVVEPLRELLNHLLCSGLLEVTGSAEAEQRSAPDEVRPVLMVVWRFFDPSLTHKSIPVDSLRCAVNHYDRSRPALRLSERRGSSKSTTSLSTKDLVQAVLLELDEEGDGKLRLDDLSSVLQELDLDGNNFVDVLNKMDVDSDGRLQIDVFLKGVFG